MAGNPSTSRPFGQYDAGRGMAAALDYRRRTPAILHAVPLSGTSIAIVSSASPAVTLRYHGRVMQSTAPARATAQCRGY